MGHARLKIFIQFRMTYKAGGTINSILVRQTFLRLEDDARHHKSKNTNKRDFFFFFEKRNYMCYVAFYF